jgi:hypothetical protein
VFCKVKKHSLIDFKRTFMIDLILNYLPDDVPAMLENFISQKEKETQGQLFVQVSYKNIKVKAQSEKNVVITIFCKQPEKVFPLSDYNNILAQTLIKKILDEHKKSFPAQIRLLITTVLSTINIQKELNKIFEGMENKHKGAVRFVLYNKDVNGKKITYIKEIYPTNEVENPFAHYFELLVRNADKIDLSQIVK